MIQDLHSCMQTRLAHLFCVAVSPVACCSVKLGTWGPDHPNEAGWMLGMSPPQSGGMLDIQPACVMLIKMVWTPFSIMIGITQVF